MQAAYIVQAARTPIGRHKGSLANVRADDLAAHVIAAVLDRAPELKMDLDHVIFGATNQAGEDNRNVARMAALLAGVAYEVPAVTVNRLCGSGMEAIIQAAMRIAVGDAEIVVAGGVESMTRAPFVFGKSDEAFARSAPKVYDTSLGWRFENPKMAERFPLQSMGETAENVAERWKITREDQDAFALRSQQRALAAQAAGRFDIEIVAVTLAQKKGDPVIVTKDEHPRDTSLESLARLQPIVKPGGSVTAGNASGVNDGSCALLIANADSAKRFGLVPKARIIAMASAGIAPRIMGMGPVPATRKVLAMAGLRLEQIEVIELNEAFAAQGLAVLRELGVADDAAHVNPNGGAIALGHPLGASGARLVATAVYELHRRKGRYALCTMCCLRTLRTFFTALKVLFRP